MRALKVVGLVIAAALGLPAQTEEAKPAVSKTPLSADELAIYTAFLKHYDNGSGAVINLADTTRPLSDFDSLPKKDEGCVKGLEFDSLPPATNIVHHTAPLAGANVRIVDPAKQNGVIHQKDPGKVLNEEDKSVEQAVKEAFDAGLMTLSEIVFTKDHQWALMSFRFVCGRLCGHGSTMIFHKVGNEWKATERDCGGWIS